MRRRRPGEGADLPPELAVFEAADWCVGDIEDPTEVGYARIRWSVTCKVFREGGDWRAHMQPPQWSVAESPRPVQRGGGNTIPIPKKGPPGSLPWEQNRVSVTPRARPIKP